MADEDTPAPAPEKNERRRDRDRKPSDESVASRASRMARRVLSERTTKWAAALGITASTPEELEQALHKIKEDREKTLPEAQRAAQRVQELERELAVAKDEAGKLRAAFNKSEKERRRMVEAQKTRQIESEIQSAATGAGFKDAGYALHLFREHVRTNGPHAGDPKAFFESLKSKNEYKHLFGEQAVPAGPQPPVPPKPPEEKLEGADAPPAPPGGALPDQGAPPPARPGKGPRGEVKDVSALDHRSFADHAKTRYGFSPTR